MAWILLAVVRPSGLGVSLGDK